MQIIIAVLAAAAVAIFLALAIPVDLAVKVDTSAANKIRVRLVWLFGILNVNLSERKPRRSGRARERKSAGPARALKRLGTALARKGVPMSAARLLRGILAAVRVRDFRLHVRFGFDDPADTGILLGSVAPLISLLRLWSLDRFSAEADFKEQVLYASGNVDLRIQPGRIVGASGLFLFSPAGLRAARAVLGR